MWIDGKCMHGLNEEVVIRVLRQKKPRSSGTSCFVPASRVVFHEFGHVDTHTYMSLYSCKYYMGTSKSTHALCLTVLSSVSLSLDVYGMGRVYQKNRE